MFENLDTPALILDADKLDANCRRMRIKMEGHRVALRPHMKTAKNVDVARIALAAPIGPITVSTLREAEYFFDHGFRDILYAVGVVPNKVPRIAALNNRGAKITVIVDSVEGAKALVDASASSNVRLPAMVEIDSDGHRAGVPPGHHSLLEIAEVLGDGLRGVMTHAGDSYNSD
ncbi:MAG: alanine racemase, partial [Usitatibacter sp.]